MIRRITQWRVGLAGKADPAVVQAINDLNNRVAQLEAMSGEPPAPAPPISSARTHALTSVAGLPGLLADPQIGKAITVSALPGANSNLSKNGVMVWFGTGLYRFNSKDFFPGQWQLIVDTGGGGVTVLKQNVTLTAPTTAITPSTAATDGALLILRITTDATGGRQITWDTTFKGVTPNDHDSRANAIDSYLFYGHTDGNWWILAKELGHA